MARTFKFILSVCLSPLCSYSEWQTGKLHWTQKQCPLKRVGNTKKFFAHFCPWPWVWKQSPWSQCGWIQCHVAPSKIYITSHNCLVMCCFAEFPLHLVGCFSELMVSWVTVNNKALEHPWWVTSMTGDIRLKGKKVLEIKVICWKFRALKAGLRTKGSVITPFYRSWPPPTMKLLRKGWGTEICDFSGAAVTYKPAILPASPYTFITAVVMSLLLLLTENPAAAAAAGQLLFQLVLWHMCSLTSWEPAGNCYPQGSTWKPNPSPMTCACSAARNAFTVALAACGHGLVLLSRAEGSGTAAPPPHGFSDFPD